MPTVGGGSFSAATAASAHAAISGVSTRRSAPAAPASSTSAAPSAHGVWRGSTSLPADARAVAISFAHVAVRGRATARTVAPHASRVASGPSALVAPSTTKDLPRRSSHLSPRATTAQSASAHAGSIAP